MRTLQEILDQDLGLGTETTEKVASEAAVEGDEIEKLAMEIGLVTDTNASPETKEQTKEAHVSLDDLYFTAFPEDADVVTQPTEKVAEETKEAAAVEEAMGEVAYDHFLHFVDGHITKIANAFAEELRKEGSDEEPPRTMGNNKVDSTAAIDTTPEQVDTHHDENHAVGDYEQKKGPMGQLKSAAFRKAVLESLIAE